MEIVVDEWIVDYIADPQKRGAVFEFLEKVLEKCDRFVTIRGEGLDQKIWQMAKESGRWKPEGRSLAKWFMRSFRNNTDKLHILEKSNAMPVPPALEEKTPSDDLYLVRAAISTGGFILTTDYRLKERLSHEQELDIRMVDEFLDHYDC